jgi:hypothetical protein
MNLTVERVRSGAEFLEFIRAPVKLYAREASYVAPLDREQYGLIHPRRSPFFSHGSASFWIARNGRDIVGRISAQIDYLASRRADGVVGFFGCLDAINDLQVVKALTDAAEKWLRMEGCICCLGPFILSINGQSGLLVEGQEHSPMIGMPWHPKYLGQLIQSCGYQIAKVLQSYELAVGPSTVNLGTKRNLRNDVHVRPLRLNRLSDEIELFRNLFNDAWKHNWGFIPLSKSDMQALARDLKPFIKRDWGVVAEYEGRPFAFLLAIPNLFHAARGLGNDPGLLGWIRFFFRAKLFRYKSARVILLGIAPSYPISIRGAALVAMLTEAIHTAELYGNLVIEAGWVLEDNYPMKRVLKLFHFTPIRTYNLYQKELK